jgi:hypothetical protein
MLYFIFALSLLLVFTTTMMLVQTYRWRKTQRWAVDTIKWYQKSDAVFREDIEYLDKMLRIKCDELDAQRIETWNWESEYKKLADTF